MMSGFFQSSSSLSDYNNELKKAISDGAFLVDVRTPAEFAGGSVVDAVNIPLDELQNRLDEFDGKTSIVVFCRSGARSGTAMQVLEQHGFEKVLNGGSWQNVNMLKAETE